MESVEGPRAWTIALRRHAAVVGRVLREEPPGRWPTAWHAVMAATLAAASVCAAYAWDRHLVARHRQALAALAHAKLQLQQAQRPAPHATPSPAVPLPQRDQLEQVVADFGQFAAVRSLRLGSLQLEYNRPAKGLMEVRFRTTLAGDYPGIKSWLGELLARYPSLALHSLSMRAEEGRPLEASVALNLYLLDRP